MKDLNEIVNFIFEVGTARNIIRSHHQVLKNSNDSVASHSFRVAIIGLILASLEQVDTNKVVLMCLLHDVAELRTGDANFINRFYQVQKEEDAINDQWFGIPGEKEAIELLSECNEGETKEAIVAKDADRLEQIFLQREYLTHPHDLDMWHTHTAQKLQTDSACKIAEQAIKTNRLQWLYDFSNSKKQK